MNSDTQIGYTVRNGKLWTVKLFTDKQITNPNEHFIFYETFELISIEDMDGKYYQKVPNYAIRKKYISPHKNPLHIHFDKTNAKMFDFYNQNYESYITYTGVVKQYHKNGTLHFEYFLNSGKINGNFISYYDNGTIQEEAFFVDGVRHGITKFTNKSCYISGNYEDNYLIVCIYDSGNLIDMKFENISEFAIYPIIQKESEKYIDGKYYYNDIRKINEPIIITNEYYNVECVYGFQVDQYLIQRYKLVSYKIELSTSFQKHNVEYFIREIPISVQNDYNARIWKWD